MRRHRLRVEVAAEGCQVDSQSEQRAGAAQVDPPMLLDLGLVVEIDGDG